MIEIKNLSKTYINAKGHHLALSNVSLNLGNKGMVFISGNSGEGKSSLMIIDRFPNLSISMAIIDSVALGITSAQ